MPQQLKSLALRPETPPERLNIAMVASERLERAAAAVIALHLIDRAHSARTKQPHNAVTSDHISCIERHLGSSFPRSPRMSGASATRKVKLPLRCFPGPTTTRSYHLALKR